MKVCELKVYPVEQVTLVEKLWLNCQQLNQIG